MITLTTKFRINASKFSVESGRYNKKNKLERIWLLYCEDMGNEIYSLTDCKNEKMKKAQSEFFNNPYMRHGRVLRTLPRKKL